MPRVEEGFIEVSGGKVWFQTIGMEESERSPLVYLHGGPGIPHYPFESLSRLSDDRPVIFYHQLGCGKSERPTDPDLWVLPRFVDELDRVRGTLGLDQIHILGHSWGGSLATEYALSHPDGIKSLILASPLLNTTRWLEDTNRLKKGLPDDIQKAITINEEQETTDTEEYKQASREFDRRYNCRLWPWPEQKLRAGREIGLDVYLTMWGPSEFHCTGNLNGFDCIPRLHELKIPVLFTCGRYDEATPETVEDFQKLIPQSEMVVFENSAHHSQLEEPEKYLVVVRNFLRRVDLNF